MAEQVTIKVFVTFENGQWLVSSGGKVNGRFQTMREVDQMLAMSRLVADRVKDRKVRIVTFVDMANPGETIF
jgi:hypothetical protein